jgi:hypothetical protein
VTWLKRHADPSPGQLQLGVVVFGLVAVLALAFSVWSLKTSVEAAADRAGNRAARESLCRVWEFQRVRPGDPPPTTARGQDLARRAQIEYDRLGCS